MTVPLAPPAVVSITRVVRLTRRSSSSRPSSSAQFSRVWLDWFLMAQPPERQTQAEDGENQSLASGEKLLENENTFDVSVRQHQVLTL